MKEWGVENLQEGLAILGVMEGEIMVPWAVMDIEERYTASMDVPQSSAAPLCPQNHPRWLCEKEKLVLCCCVTCYMQRS